MDESGNKIFLTFLMVIWLLLFSIVHLSAAPDSCAAIPLPTGQHIFEYPSLAFPVANMHPVQARPLGIGSAAEGGDTLRLLLSLSQCDGRIDIFIAFFFPALDMNNVYLLKPDNTFQTLSQGLVAWRPNITGPVNQALLDDIPTTILSQGTYYLAVMVTPTGNPANYYLWITSFDVVANGEMSMITPYVNESDMASINEAYSSDNSAPWGFAHGGIDLFPSGNLEPFQAVFAGVVEDVRLWPNDATRMWQVNVKISYNAEYAVYYAFEPFSTDPADGQIQLDNISVSIGQFVSQGDVIGNLYTVGEAAHVDFSLYRNGVVSCPEPYFTPEARDSIFRVLHIVWPNARMCYGN